MAHTSKTSQHRSPSSQTTVTTPAQRSERNRALTGEHAVPRTEHPDAFQQTAAATGAAVQSPRLATPSSPRLPPPPVGYRYARPKPSGTSDVADRKYELVPAKSSGGLGEALKTFAQRVEGGPESSVPAEAVRRMISLVRSEGTPSDAVESLRKLSEAHGQALAPEARTMLGQYLEHGGERPADGALWDPPESGSAELGPRSEADRVSADDDAPVAAPRSLSPQAAPAPAAAQPASSTSASASTEGPARVDGARSAGARFVPGHAWRGGMGAIPHDGGTTFRLWAPNARRVQVIGDFNGWNLWDAKELWRDGAGNWSGFVPDAHHGQRYKYVIEGKYGDWRWRNDPRAAHVTNSTGDSVIYDQNAYQWQAKHFDMPPFNEAVIYEMHVGSFHDSPGWGPGNWNSAMAKLDYLKWQGINVVKLMPVSEFPGDFSKGYNPAYPFAPESAYGHPDDMKRFVDECHKRGIAVIVDVVFNHWGPNDLPHWDLDGETWGHGGEYFYDDWRSQTPWGDTRPNFGRHEVREYIKDNVFMWLREFGVQGIRADATSEVRRALGMDLPEGYSLLKEINEAVDREFPGALMIAEDMQADPGITHPWGANFDSQWDREFVHTVRDFVTAPSDEARDMYRLARAISHSYNGDATERVIYSESHDEVSAMNGKMRLPSQIGGWDSGGWYAKKLSTFAAALTFTSPGIPMIFQGQEFLEDGQWRDDDPVNWERADHFSGIKEMYREFAQLKRNWHNNTQGLKGNNLNIHHINNADKVIAHHRWDKGGPGDDVVVIANASGRTLKGYNFGLPSDGLWKVRLNSDWDGFSPDFGSTPVFDVAGRWEGRDGMPASGTIDLPPYSVIILSQDR